MINVNFADIKSDDCSKNVLYKIKESMDITFSEEHLNSKEILKLKFCLEDCQFGIYAKEYKRPGMEKTGCKAADVLACVVDSSKKRINTLVLDVKSNISSFSDDLTKDSAVLTAVKSVRDFVEQLHAELLHKESFMLYYKDDGYVENENIGIATKNFDESKFSAVADFMKKLFEVDSNRVPLLVKTKLVNSFVIYALPVHI